MQPWKSRKPCMKMQQESLFRLLGACLGVCLTACVVGFVSFVSFVAFALATCKLDEIGSRSA